MQLPTDKSWVTWNGQLCLSLGPQFPHCSMWRRLLLPNVSPQRQGNSSTFTHCPTHPIQKIHWTGRKHGVIPTYLGYNPSHIWEFGLLICEQFLFSFERILVQFRICAFPNTGKAKGSKLQSRPNSRPELGEETTDKTQYFWFFRSKYCQQIFSLPQCYMNFGTAASKGTKKLRAELQIFLCPSCITCVCINHGRARLFHLWIF